jgi:hypothetical protein
MQPLAEHRQDVREVEDKRCGMIDIFQPSDFSLNAFFMNDRDD